MNYWFALAAVCGVLAGHQAWTGDEGGATALAVLGSVWFVFGCAGAPDEH